MAFAIKNIFQKGASPDPSQADDRQTSGGTLGNSPFTTVQAAPGGFNPGFGGALFKTLGSDPLDGAPVAARPGGSPFSPHAAADSTVLTVADLLPVLPPELARANGAMPDQPVALAPHVLETAISSGQLAVPIFEVYRVCPALFQTPVSPHDPRMVSLPRGKLPNLIASHTGALKPAVESSPFLQAPQSGGSPFAPALPEVPPAGMMTQGLRPAGALPPRRPPGIPPAIPTQADFMNGTQASGGLSLPNHDQPQSAAPFAASPFGTLQAPSAGAVPGQTSLLFSSPQPPNDPELAASAEAASPFAAMASPFATAPLPAMSQPSPSPFSVQMPTASGASPFAPAVASFEMAPQQPAPELPKLGQLPFAAPQSPPPMPGASPFGTPQPMMPLSRPVEAVAAASNEMLQVSLAAVLKGHGAQDLGFDPNFIPAWINTKLPAYIVQPQLASGQVSMDLGTIIDGTEPTFRSVIAHGRRGYTVRMLASDVFQTGATPNSSESTFSLPAAPPSPLAPSPAMVSPLPGLVQPLASVSRPFNPGSGPSMAESATLPPAKPEGMGSEQLFGEQPFAPAPQRAMFSPLTAGVQALPEILAPAMPGNPIMEQAATPMAQTRDSNRTPSTPLFKAASAAHAISPPEFKAPSSSVPGGSVMGLSAVGESEQMLLRALLGHTGRLDAGQVVKLTAQLPGIIACVNVRQGQVHGQAEASKPAQEFREQAADISRSMRTLAGVIGIDAETLSIAAGERTITFCFQPDNAFGVLHQDSEPASGLREKITLLGREIARLPI